MPQDLSTEQFLLTILVKLAVIAVLATMLARYHRFRHILIFERRGWLDRLVFMVALGVPLAAGVAFRVQLRYYAADLTLEGALLAGLIAGPYTGALVGLMVSLTAVLLTAVHTGSVFTGEFIALPFAVGCGFAGGGLREACPTKETIWRFTPFVILDLPKHLFKMLRNREPLWQIILLLAPVALELLRQFLGLRFNKTIVDGSHTTYITRLFYLEPPRPWMMILVVLAAVLAVAFPIKIWNSARIEHRLQEQEKLLLAAKIESLKSQINPHFLFNTLTSISSLIRAEPDTARTLIIRLSALLRRLLRSHEHFVTLRDELEAIDEYLDIEVIRFGPQLKVVKDIEPETMDLIVPSMILQPLVENSIKHGFSRKVGPGVITIRSHRENGRAVIEVEDDGMGFFLESLDQPMSSGIGLANVRERLRVIYGATYQLKLTSEPGRGTLARIEVPELATVHPISA